MGLMVITSFVFAVHFTRRVDSRQRYIFLKKLYKKDGSLLKNYIENFKTLNPLAYSRFVKTEYEKIESENNKI
jgi:hypothetical protein